MATPIWRAKSQPTEIADERRPEIQKFASGFFEEKPRSETKTSSINKTQQLN